VASATRAITARCFCGNKEVKAGKEYPVEPDGFYTSDRLFSLQAAISLINRPSLYLYLHLTFYFYPSLHQTLFAICIFPAGLIPYFSTLSLSHTPLLYHRWLYLPHSHAPHISIEFTAVLLSGEGIRPANTVERRKPKNRWAAKWVKSYLPASPE